MDWSDTDSIDIASIESISIYQQRNPTNNKKHTGDGHDTYKQDGNGTIEEQKEASHADQHTHSHQHSHSHSLPSHRSTQSNGIAIQSPGHKKNRSSTGGSGNTHTHTLTGVHRAASGSPASLPYSPLNSHSIPLSASASSIASPTRYSGMHSAKTEWLLPTRVSVSGRTTATTAAKTNLKSPKSEKTWRGYIPDHQAHAFDLSLHHPKVLSTPLSALSLPGAKSAHYEGAIPRVPVSEAQTRASLDKRTEKNARAAKGVPTHAQILEDEIEQRRADKRARFELETERAKECLWRESTSLAQKHSMLHEERAFVEDLRAKVRAHRHAREEKWRAEELKLRQKENSDLRIPEARLAKYERWFREEQENQIRQKYIQQHGQEPPEGYATQTAQVQDEDRSEFEVKEEDSHGEESSAAQSVEAAILQQTLRFPTAVNSVPSHSAGVVSDSGRFVSISFGGWSAGGASSGGVGSVGMGIGLVPIEFEMVGEDHPDAHAPLLQTINQRANNINASPNRTHHSRPHSQSGVPRPHSSHGSIGTVSQLATGDGHSLNGADVFDDIDVDASLDNGDGLNVSGAARSAGHTRDTSRSRTADARTRQQASPSRNAYSTSQQPTQDDGDDDDDATAQSDEFPAADSHRVSRSGRRSARDDSHESQSREAAGPRSNQTPNRANTQSNVTMHVEPNAFDPASPPPTGPSHSDSSRHRRSSSSSSSSSSLDAAVSSPFVSPADSSLLSDGFDSIKIPRKVGLFSQPKKVTLRVTRTRGQSESGAIKDKWIIAWDSKAKKTEEEFINLSDQLKRYQKGIDQGALAQFSADLTKKYQDRADFCYTLTLSDRTLDLVLSESLASDAFDRVLAAIVQHKQQTEAGDNTEREQHTHTHTDQEDHKDATDPNQSPASSSQPDASSHPSASAVSSPLPPTAGAAIAHAAVSAHSRGVSGLAITPIGSSRSNAITTVAAHSPHSPHTTITRMPTNTRNDRADQHADTDEEQF